MEVQLSLQDCVEFFKLRAGDQYEVPEMRAACVLASHTLEALVSKKKKWYKKKVNIKVELEGEQKDE